MKTNDKLKIYQDDSMLSMEYRWFNPGALFMVFFCVIWFAFLTFWYGMAAGTGAPWIFFVFPLIHVSVGVWLAYYSMCQLFNKTKIIVNDNLLNVLHYPIPWYKGNKRLPTGDLTQFYVKQKVSQGKNNTERYTYTIRAKLKDGKDIEVASIAGLPSEDAQRIEEYLEQYLGIDNITVKGEYGASKKGADAPRPRRIRRSSLPEPLEKLYQLKVGEWLPCRGEQMEAAHLSQYDWNNGDSDKLFQLLNEEGQETLLYLQKNNALLHIFLEQKLSLLESRNISFYSSSPPDTIEYQGKKYLLNEHESGQVFLTGVTHPLDIDQWRYLSADKQFQIRIVENKGMLSFYVGEKTDLSAFEESLNERLDLRELDKEGLTDWEDEELV